MSNLKYFPSTDSRFKFLNFKVIAFLMLLVVLLLLTGGVFGWRHDFFSTTVYFETAPNDARALSPGMEVTLYGIHVGRVTSVTLNEAGKPLLILKVRANVLKWLHQDAILRLSGLEPLGQPFLNLYPGSDDAPPLRPGTRITFERESTISETVSKIEKELLPVIANMHSIVRDLNRPDGDLRESLAAVRTITQTFESDLPPTLAMIQKSANSTVRLIEEIQSKESDVSKTRDHLLGITSRLDKQLPILLTKTEASLNSLKNTTADLELITKTTAPKILDLVHTSQRTTQSADALIADSRDIWLLKLLLPRKSKTKSPEETQR